MKVQGIINLRMTFGIELHIKTIDVQFLVIDSHMILRRLALSALGAMVSIPHLTLKFLVLTIEIGVAHATKMGLVSAIMSH